MEPGRIGVIFDCDGTLIGQVPHYLSEESMYDFAVANYQDRQDKLSKEKWKICEELAAGDQERRRDALGDIVGERPHGSDLWVEHLMTSLPGGQTGWVLRLTLDKQGLLAWDTRLAQMDLEGTPHPVPGGLSPCGIPGKQGLTVGECVNP